VNHLSVKGRRVTIVGNCGGTNIGGSFERAARIAGLDFQVIEPRQAMEAPAWLRRFNWYFRGKRPTWLNSFSNQVVQSCARHKSEVVVVTGISGLNADALKQLSKAGVRVANYLTDDPWNRWHRAPWFLKALPEYFAVFSPRRANLRDLEDVGCRRASYLPFGYDPELHFPEAPSNDERTVLATDVLFVGGADKDRIPVCSAIAESGLSLAIYGDYWDRHAVTQPFYRGYADLAMLRRATAGAAVCLCLTRKANRDGHTMRSYEVPAMKGVALAEATDDHREMFGEEGDCALFFRDTSEMVDKAKWLLAHQEERRQMADRAYARITDGKNTYRDRLETILDICINR
jgi:spore maturation protein CgeB